MEICYSCCYQVKPALIMIRTVLIVLIVLVCLLFGLHFMFLILKHIHWPFFVKYSLDDCESRLVQLVYLWSWSAWEMWLFRIGKKQSFLTVVCFPCLETEATNVEEQVPFPNLPKVVEKFDGTVESKLEWDPLAGAVVAIKKATLSMCSSKTVCSQKLPADIHPFKDHFKALRVQMKGKIYTVKMKFNQVWRVKHKPNKLKKNLRIGLQKVEYNPDNVTL